MNISSFLEGLFLAGTKAKEFKVVKYVHSETNVFGCRERSCDSILSNSQVCFCYLRQENKILLSR